MSLLHKEQDTRIRYLLNLAYEHNHFLHELLDTAGIRPGKVKPGDGKRALLEAYERGVRTSSEDLVKGKLYPDYTRSIYSTQLWTSGTTGKPKIVLYSSDDFERSDAQVRQLYETISIESGRDGIVGFVAPFPFATAFLVPSSFRQLGIPSATFVLPSIVPQMQEEEARFRLRPVYETVKNVGKSRMIIGGTYGIERLGVWFARYGFDTNLLDIRALAFGAEPTTLERRKTISQQWQRDKANITYDLYASSEGSVMAFECSAHQGLHVCQPEVFVFAGKEGRPLREEQEGQDVVTVLPRAGCKPGTFILNYSHGDLLKVHSGECGCGLPVYRISHPRRETEQIRIAGYGLDVRDLEGMLNKRPYTGEYLVIWKVAKEARLAHKLVVRIESAGPMPHTIEDLKRHLASSNPIAYDVLFASGAVEVELEIVAPGMALAGYEKLANPGKSTRLVRT